MDRSLLEADPHAVLEGMMIGARAIRRLRGIHLLPRRVPAGARAPGPGDPAVPREGPARGAISSARTSIRHPRRARLRRVRMRRRNRLDALGGRAPRRAAPPAAVPGLEGPLGKPSVLNNVETFANVPLIIRNGADWYRSVGHAESPGTKIFALTGKVQNVGLVEVNMGSPWARSSTTSAAAFRAARSSRPRRSADRPAAASRRST